MILFHTATVRVSDDNYDDVDLQSESGAMLQVIFSSHYLPLMTVGCDSHTHLSHATEVYLLSRDKVKWHWYENPDSLDPGGMWDNRVDQAEDDPELRTFYLAQLVVSSKGFPEGVIIIYFHTFQFIYTVRLSMCDYFVSQLSFWKNLPWKLLQSHHCA